MPYKCEICGREVPDYKPQYCCGGYECGCRGLPVEPCICSNDCWDKLMHKAQEEGAEKTAE